MVGYTYLKKNNKNMKYLKKFENYDIDVPIAKELVYKFDIEFEDALDLSEIYDIIMGSETQEEKENILDDMFYNGYYEDVYNDIWNELNNYVKSWLMITEKTNIPDRYKDMGFTEVGKKKKSNRKGKKWMVLAKKDDKYKVVHGGDSNMQDFKQHKDKDRQKRFWDRMGGKDSAKAKDPFSPLYWHKKFGTW